MPTETQHTAEYVTLRDYVDTRFEAQNKATDIAFNTMEIRLSGMNEIRGTLKDQAGTFLTKVEFDAYKEKLDGEIRILRESKAMLEGKASQSALTVSTIISVVGLLIGIIGLVLHFIE